MTNLRHSIFFIKQEIKAKSTLECYMNKQKYMPVRDAFDLFHTLVKAIVIFDSEIWGINISKGIEQFHLTFMKSEDINKKVLSLC